MTSISINPAAEEPEAPIEELDIETPTEELDTVTPIDGLDLPPEETEEEVTEEFEAFDVEAYEALEEITPFVVSTPANWTLTQRKGGGVEATCGNSGETFVGRLSDFNKRLRA